MKTTLRILIILAVSAIVSAGLWLAVNTVYGSASSQPPRNLTESGIERPLPPGDQREGQEGLPGRPDGDGEREGRSGIALGRGLAEIVKTLIKLAIVIFLVLLVQKGISIVFTPQKQKRPV